MDHRPTVTSHPSRRRFPRRRLLTLICAILCIFILSYAYLIHSELRRWNHELASQESCIVAERMTDQLNKYPPFDAFPAPNAARITLFNRSLGLVGYETWTRLDFTQERDFKDYMHLVTSHPLVAEDAKMAFDYDMRLPQTMAKTMKEDLATSGVRATLQGVPSRQWIFLPQQRRVFAVCTD